MSHGLRRDPKGGSVFTYGGYEHDEKSSEHRYAVTNPVGKWSDNGVYHKLHNCFGCEHHADRNRFVNQIIVSFLFENRFFLFPARCVF